MSCYGEKEEPQPQVVEALGLRTAWWLLQDRFEETAGTDVWAALFERGR